jgi:selenocysteine lyase/cysteine desulfurase
MRRRDFLQASTALSTGMWMGSSIFSAPPDSAIKADLSDWRSLFPRLKTDVYLNAARGTPLSAFSEEATQAYMDLWKFGGADGRSEVFRDTMASIRAEFAGLVHVDETEIALVSCTKEGEQNVLDSVRPWDGGGHVVTNMYHFSGSLHNYEGHRRQGREVRIIWSDDWDLEVERVLEAIDDSTRLVCVTLVSNFNGRVEDVKVIAAKAHRHGALVFADIIQAVGIVPVNLRELDVDFASCSCYKWLYGPHGVGFFYVRKGLQGNEMLDRLFPGNSRQQVPPWTEDAAGEKLSFSMPEDARRYEPGHHSYIGYASVLAGIRFLRGAGIEDVQEYSLGLSRLLRELIDEDRYPSISPTEMVSPIVTFEKGHLDITPALMREKLVISVSEKTFRVSPTIYNTEDDVRLLAATLNGV